jgi:hypothetical protein
MQVRFLHLEGSKVKNDGKLNWEEGHCAFIKNFDWEQRQCASLRVSEKIIF